MVREIFSAKDEYFEQFKKMPNTKAKVIKGTTPVAVDVYGSERVLIFNYPDTFILIQDKNTATSFRNFFEQLWKLN